MALSTNPPDAFVIVSGDEDLTNAVRAAKDSHANVYLGYAHNPEHDLYSAKKLRREVDHQINIADGFLEEVTQ